MSSPRKFSEKIALHKKKLAEETAAFEAVLREVSATTKAALEKQQKLPTRQHLAQPSVGVIRGGSLPDVSEMTNSNSVDLQSALLNLENMKHGRDCPGLVDKFHRDKNRQTHSSLNQRRRLPTEKRADCSPYGLTYLSPPSDTSWRRSNSDSAIHSGAVGPPQSPQQQHHSPPSPTSPVNRHADFLSSDDVHKGDDIWSHENLSLHSRAHDVPGISIYSSSLNETRLLPIALSNDVPLPDLADLHFSSPLGGPCLDTSDRGYNSSGHSNNVAIGGQHAGHIGPMRTSQHSNPSTRRRQSHGSPSPIALYGSSPTHSGVHGILPQYRNSSECPQSPTSPLSQHSYSPSDSPGLPNCTLSSSPFTDIYALQQQQMMAQESLLQQHFEQFTMLQDSPLPPSNSSSLYNLMNQPPHSQPVGSGLRFGPSSLLSPGKSGQDMDVTPEALHLIPDLCYQQFSPSSPRMYSAVPGSLASVCHLPTSPTRPRFAVSKSSNQSKSGNKIPDIILTGVDEGRCHDDRFGKGTLLGFSEPFDSELFSIDDALRVGLNPLELDELQMLTDPNVVTDPATEDSFRLDQL